MSPVWSRSSTPGVPTYLHTNTLWLGSVVVVEAEVEGAVVDVEAVDGTEVDVVGPVDVVVLDVVVLVDVVTPVVVVTPSVFVVGTVVVGACVVVVP